MRLVLIAAGLFFVMLVTLINNRKRRQFEYECTTQMTRDVLTPEDEVLGVKKVVPTMQRTAPVINTEAEVPLAVTPSVPEPRAPVKPQIVTLHLMASPDKPFLGYELLQALQSAGLRFGDMNIFHRHEHEHGLGRVLFSVAKANEPGTFDMENMGATACYGLTFFMMPEGNENDEVSEEIMLHTVYELADDLGGTILDSKRNILN